MYEIGRIVLAPQPRNPEAEDRELAAELLEVASEAELNDVLRRLVAGGAPPVRAFARSPGGRAVMAVLRRTARDIGMGRGGRPTPDAARSFVRLAHDTARRAASLPAYAPQMAAVTAAVEAAPRSLPESVPQLQRSHAAAKARRAVVAREIPSPRPTLRRGSRGASVADLQRRLDAWLRARTGGRVAVDSMFGSLTDAAVRAFQQASGLAADGIVGPLTWAALLTGAPSPPRPTVPTGPPPANWSTVTVGPGDVVDVHGIRVHRLVADQVRRLVEAAAGDGVPLKGWGYRDRQRQIELRRAHCGPSDDDIYRKPASQCTPPTAPPGRSRHEQGLAIDFHDDADQSIRSSSAAFRWLAANAARFGFINLPSESWHWSVDGH